MPDFVHQTVLLAETVAVLRPASGKVFVDGTLGGGGHSEALLRAGAKVLGFDKDARAREAASLRLSPFESNIDIVNAPFSQVSTYVKAQVDGVLLDLGVSSPQLDVAERGFSFQVDGPLDMRMGDNGPTAAMFIAETAEPDLADVLYRLADERFSRPIARALKAKAPQTTFELVDAVKSAVPRRAWPKDIHVATRTFQALRMAVNEELDELASALEQIPALLKVGGVCAIISFHSLEDRAVKLAFRQWCGEATESDPRIRSIQMLQIKPVSEAPFQMITKRAVTASKAELAENPRSRSAKLRAVEKRA
jgi:16S rRNA (cytosine1402-N4)-methyltransferase